MAFYTHRRILSRTLFSAALAASFIALWCDSNAHADDGYYAGSETAVQATAEGDQAGIATPECGTRSSSGAGANCDVACDEYLAQCGCGDSWWEGGETDLGRRLKSSGITFDNNLTSFYYGVAGGGEEQEFRYAGHGDYLMNVDFMKMGGPPGLFLKIRAEHRIGETIGEPAGSLLPPVLASDLPTPETQNLYLTNVLFTQALSENFAVFAGKLDTLDGDMNAFASGRGITQFSNSAMVITPIGLRTIAYSTLGTGFVVLDEGEPVFTFLVLNARESVRTAGFDELFAEGVVLSPELRIATDFLQMPGHQMFGGTWSSRNYVSLDQDPRILLPNVPIDRADDSWSLYWNMDQYLVVDPSNPKRGWGVFARAGVADAATNPIANFFSAGVGGNSRLFGRDADTFGVGWFYAGTSNELAPALATALGGVRDSQGGEVFHNFAVNSRLAITWDGQVLLPAREEIDYTLVTGLRVNLRF
jgi:porin